jgi:uncharacterized UPF0160 family protein
MGNHHRPLEIATHNGKFHADEVFAVLILLRLYPDASVIRTRDPRRINQADFVVDVGNVYNHGTGRYDHHSTEVKLFRLTDIPYASAGLVWHHYGQEYLQMEGISSEIADDVQRNVDAHLIQLIDGVDTGSLTQPPTISPNNTHVGSISLSRTIAMLNSLPCDLHNEEMQMDKFQLAMKVSAGVLTTCISESASRTLANLNDTSVNNGRIKNRHKRHRTRH